MIFLMHKFSTSASFPVFTILEADGNCHRKLLKFPQRSHLCHVLYIVKSPVYSFKTLLPNHGALISDNKPHRSNQICSIGVHFFHVTNNIFIHFEGILNFECAALPPGINDTMILDDAITIATSPSPLNLVRIKVVTNVFPVLPGTSMKIIE